MQIIKICPLVVALQYLNVVIAISPAIKTQQ